MPATDVARVLVDGLDHPEGVAWDPEAEVVWAGGEDGQLYRVTLDGRAEQVARAPSFVLGLAVDGRGRLAVCASEDGSLCVAEGAAVRPVLREVDGAPLVLPNYPAFSPDGTLWLSASGTWARDDGRLVRVAADGTATTFARDRPCFTNGLAVSPDGRWLWVAESNRPRVSRYDLAAGEGRAETVVELPGTVPDGLALTAGGGLLISLYRPDRILHLGPDGALDVVADDPQGTLIAAPTNVCFAGRDLDVLVGANLGRWHLTRYDLGLRGAPPHRPAPWAADALKE
jgi:sugar lactone lactonase YvrE